MFGMMEAMLSFLRRQVGLRTDSASASGSLHAKVSEFRNFAGAYLALKGSIASDTLRTSADTERSFTGLEMEIVKSIRVFVRGTIRVSFELRNTDSAYPARGQIYKNGVPHGSERKTLSLSYVTFTEDIEVTEGDYVQLAIGGAPTTFCRNFRIYYDYRTYDNIVITN